MSQSTILPAVPTDLRLNALPAQGDRRLSAERLLRACTVLLIFCAGCHTRAPANPCSGWHEGGGACRTAADCSWSGDCVASACVCDAPYTGSTCAGLDIGPSNVALDAPGDSFWDGSLYASRFTNGCGLDSWAHNSECVRATSGTPLGPYGDPVVIVPTLCHNATARRTPGGDVLFYSIGEPATGGEITDCDGGVTTGTVPSSLNASTCVIEVARASDVAGPFDQLVALTSPILTPLLCPTNPAPVIEADESVRMFYRAYASVDTSTHTTQEKLYLSHTASWAAPVDQAGTLLFDALAEDPFVWTDARRGTMHVLYNAKFEDANAIGGHAVTPDGVHWTVLPPAYTLEVPFSDSTTHTVARRERPQIFWEDSCHGVLLTAVQPDESDDSSYVIAAPVGPPGEGR